MKQENINNMVSYLCELWENESDEEWNYHWKELIGLSDDDMREQDLVRKE